MDRDVLLASLKGLGFSRGASQAAAGAVYSHLQIFNPVGSGVLVAVSLFRAATNNATGNLSARQHNTALTTLIGTGFNKNFGVVGSVAEIRSQNNGTLLGSSIDLSRINANERFYFAFDDPIILGAGTGLLLVPEVVNTSLIGGVHWREYA